MCKNGEACCYCFGYKMSLQKTMNVKSCVSCKEDNNACVFSLAIVHFICILIKGLKTLAYSHWMILLCRSLDMF